MAMGSARSGGRVRACGVVLAVLAGLSGLAVAAPAAAGQDPGIRIGAYDGADADVPVVAVGVYGRLDVPGPLNLELSADYRREQLRGNDSEATVVPVRATAILSFLPVVSPYVAAGVGADFVRIDFDDAVSAAGSESSVLMELHAGVGVEIGLGPLSVIADVRYCSVEGMADAAVREALGRDYDASGWYASLSAGISF
jgi:hypothetical protein